jgi:hypothetical protein
VPTEWNSEAFEIFLAFQTLLKPGLLALELGLAFFHKTLTGEPVRTKLYVEGIDRSNTLSYTPIYGNLGFSVG